MSLMLEVRGGCLGFKLSRNSFRRFLKYITYYAILNTTVFHKVSHFIVHNVKLSGLNWMVLVKQIVFPCLGLSDTMKLRIITVGDFPGTT